MPTESLAKKLTIVLESHQKDTRKVPYRLVPSTFSGSDAYLQAVPLWGEWQWPTLEEHLKRFEPETIILQLPTFWQLEPFVQTSARNAGAPLCVIEPQNFPLDKAAIRLASANTIIAEASEAAAIAEYLHAGQVALPHYWVLIHAADAVHWKVPQLLQGRGQEVAEEVQLVPGVPLLVQCKAIVDARSGQYHESDIFVWNSNLVAPMISATETFPFTLKDVALPFALKDEGVCLCGKRLVARAS